MKPRSGLLLAVFALACATDDPGPPADTDSNGSTAAPSTSAASTASSSTTAMPTSSTTAPTSATSTESTSDPMTSAASTSAESSTGGEPNGPTTGFCQCSLDNPAPDAGSFEMCAEMLADGTGTYYELGPYVRTPDADTQAGVPTGTVTQDTFNASAVYPGTSWDYWVYVPAQYDGASEAALLVLTDGGVYVNNGGGAAYRTPTVLDNLIDEGAMPVTIAVFVDPGVNGPNSTRSLEYDTPDAAYVTFLLDELLPVALAGYEVTDDPSLRAIGGRSSGGAAGFTAGWEQPGAFGLIYTTIGSFVQLRANDDGEFSDKYPGLIESEPRMPLRVTLLSGINDLDNEFGNWRDAHMAMTTALDCAGYTYRSGFGEGAHSDSSHTQDEFGNDLRWLFQEAL